MKIVVLASSPRVGSSLLADSLTRAGLGYISEHFNLYHQVPNLIHEKGHRSLEEHFEHIIDEYADKEKRFFTVKAHFDHFYNYSKRVNIFSYFSDKAFVRLRRRSLQDQAISYFLAKVTGQFSSGSKSKIEREKLLSHIMNMSDKSVAENFNKIKFRLQENEQYWDFVLGPNNQGTIYYEDLFDESGFEKAKSIFDSVYNMDTGLDIQNSPLRVQRDNELSALIKSKLENGAPGPIDAKNFFECLSFNNNFFGFSPK